MSELGGNFPHEDPIKQARADADEWEAIYRGLIEFVDSIQPHKGLDAGSRARFAERLRSRSKPDQTRSG